MSTSRSEISSKYGVCLEEEEEEEEGHFCVLQFSGAAQRALQQKYTIHLKPMQYTLSIKSVSYTHLTLPTTAEV